MLCYNQTNDSFDKLELKNEAFMEERVIKLGVAGLKEALTLPGH